MLGESQQSCHIVFIISLNRLPSHSSRISTRAHTRAHTHARAPTPLCTQVGIRFQETPGGKDRAWLPYKRRVEGSVTEVSANVCN